jgi:hypothetical protein
MDLRNLGEHLRTWTGEAHRQNPHHIARRGATTGPLPLLGSEGGGPGGDVGGGGVAAKATGDNEDPGVKS